MHLATKTKIAIVFLIAAVFVGGVYLRKEAPRPSVNATLTLKTLDGATVSLADQKGSPVFVNFFATWCPPCRAEFPEISKLHERYNAKGVKVISISVDNKGDYPKVHSFVNANNARQLVLYGENSQKLASQFGVSGIPANFLLGADGKILNSWVGFDPSEIQKWNTAIDKILAGNSSI